MRYHGGCRWQLPLGLIVQPLSETDAEVPTVNLGSAGIVRCKRCRTYINPFVRWVDGGRYATPPLPEHYSHRSLIIGLNHYSFLRCLKSNSKVTIFHQWH